MSATLGGLLKDYRLQKNLSQLEISFAMGWKEPSRLSRIEQGKVETPPRELLDRLMEVMELKKHEKGNLLLAAGYLPTDEEIENIKQEIDPIIQDWPYPVEVMDFSWRLLHWNKPITLIYKQDKNTEIKTHKNHPRILELIFDPNFIQNKCLKDKEMEEWHNFLLQLLVIMKTSFQKWTKEKWYLDFIRKMMNNDLFRNLWVQAKIPQEVEGFCSYYKKSLVNPEDTNKRLNFYIFDTTLIQDPRFITSFHTPADAQTYNFFQQKNLQSNK